MLEVLEFLLLPTSPPSTEYRPKRCARVMESMVELICDSQVDESLPCGGAYEWNKSERARANASSSSGQVRRPAEA